MTAHETETTPDLPSGNSIFDELEATIDPCASRLFGEVTALNNAIRCGNISEEGVLQQLTAGPSNY